MNVLDQETTIVTHLMDVCKDGRDFYRSAADKVESNGLEDIFIDSANARDAIIIDLQDYMKQKGESVKAEGTVTGKAASFFGELAATITPNTGKTFVTQLEEAEDRSLEEFQKAMSKNITPALKERIAHHKDDLQHTHFRMKTLKDVLKAA